MKRLVNTLQKTIAALEMIPTSLTLWLTSFTSLIFARMMVENWLGGFETHSLQFLFYEFTHTFFFFFLSFLILWPIIAFFGKTSLVKASTIILFGFLIILTPPLLDVWIAHGTHLWSFYTFDSLAGLWHRYLTLFGDRPDIGITYGVRIEVVITTLFLGIYTYLKTQHVWRALAASMTTYTLLFVLGTFPSWMTFLILGFQKNVFLMNDIDIAQLFLSPPILFTQSHFEFISNLNIKMSLIYAPLSILTLTFYLWRYLPQKFFALLHNARIPQIMYHGGLFFTGIGLAILFSDASLPLTLFNILGLMNMLIAIGCAWLASVIANDLFDQKIDALTNPARPLQQHTFSSQEYKTLGIIFFAISLIFSALISFKGMLLLLVYQALAWMYSAWPLRLKRFPLIATFSSAVASVIIIILGFTLIAPDNTIEKLPLSFIAFFLFILTISLPLKDFKDIAGDKADSVYTIPVLLGDQSGKLAIGSAFFLSYILSVSLFHEPKLFWWALLCGSLSFWVLVVSQPNEQHLFSYRKLAAWLFNIIALYVIILTKILFF
jgi:chlorophyll synthase